MNLIRTLDYYKSGTVTLIPKGELMTNIAEKGLNDSNTSINNSKIKELLNNSYSNLQNIQEKKIENIIESDKIVQSETSPHQLLKIKIRDAYTNLDQLKKTLNNINNGSKQLENDRLNKTFSHLRESGGVGFNQTVDTSLINQRGGKLSQTQRTSKIPEIYKNDIPITIQNLEREDDDINNSKYKYYLTSREYPQIVNTTNSGGPNNKTISSSHRYQHKTFSNNPDKKLECLSTYRNTQDPGNLSPIFSPLNNLHNNGIISNNISLINSPCGGKSQENISEPKFRVSMNNKYSLESEIKMLREETDNIYLTNQILNKSNLDLKNQLRQFESDLETFRQMRKDYQEAQNQIDNLKEELLQNEKANNELVHLYENLRERHDGLQNDNDALRSKIDNLNKAIGIHEKTNTELKTGLESVDEILVNYDNEKSLLNLQIDEKQKKINEFEEKLNLANDLNENLRKSINDYEEMLANMKKTIEILKMSSDNCEGEIFKLKCIINDIEIESKSKIQDLLIAEKNLAAVKEENILLKNELSFYTNMTNNKENLIKEHSKINNDLLAETEKLKMKIENLNLIIEDKDNTIQNIQTSYETVNSTLEELKNESENLKRKLNDEILEKNRIIKNKEFNDLCEKERDKKLEALNKNKENLQKNYLIKESELNELKEKIISYNIENIELEKKLKEKENEINLIKNNIRGCDTEKEELTNINNQLREKITLLNKEIEKLKALLNSKESEIDNFDSIINKKDDLYSNLLKERNEIERENVNLSVKITELEQNIFKLTDRNNKTINSHNLTELELKNDINRLTEDNKNKIKIIEILTKKK